MNSLFQPPLSLLSRARRDGPLRLGLPRLVDPPVRRRDPRRQGQGPAPEARYVKSRRSGCRRGRTASEREKRDDDTFFFFFPSLSTLLPLSLSPSLSFQTRTKKHSDRHDLLLRRRSARRARRLRTVARRSLAALESQPNLRQARTGVPACLEKRAAARWSRSSWLANNNSLSWANESLESRVGPR